MTEVLHVDPHHPDAASIARAAACLRRGGLVAFPTETVYGLGVHALDATAVRRLFDAKRRPAHDPLIVHVLSLADAHPLTRELPETARALAARYWPGPLTMVVRRAAVVPDEVTAGLDTVALRVPSHPVARALLAEAGVPIAAPSANLFSRPSPTRAEHVYDDLAGRIDLIVDGGPTEVGVESTVVDLSGRVPAVLRPGAVTIEMLDALLPGIAHGEGQAGGPLRSPGLLTKHYAPRAPLTLFEGRRPGALARLAAAARTEADRGRRVGIMLTTEDAAEVRRALGAAESVAHFTVLASEHDLEGIAARLYASLRELDRAEVDVILARAAPAETGLGAAIHDRLRRAASGRIVRA